MNTPYPHPAEMDDVDDVARQIRGRREGRHHPDPGIFGEHSGPDTVSQDCVELERVLAQVSDRAGDLLMPHAGDVATSALSDLLATRTLTPRLLGAASDYDRRCREAEEAAGVEVDRVDCADIATSLIELVEPGNDLDPADASVVVRYLLPGLGGDEVGRRVANLARLAESAESALSLGDPDEVTETEDDLVAAAEDMVWASLCSLRHPDAPSPEAAVVAEARRSGPGHTR